jgi:lipocalin
MLDASFAKNELLLQEPASHNTRCGWKVLTPLALLIGLGFAAFLSSDPYAHGSGPAITSLAMQVLRPARTPQFMQPRGSPSMQLARGSPAVQPPRPWSMASMLGGPSKEATRLTTITAAGPIEALPQTIDPKKAMGTWYVQRQIPALDALEKGATNGKEVYTWDGDGKFSISYTFNKGGFDGALTTVNQKGSVASEEGTTWKVSPQLGPFLVPFKLPFLLIDFDPSFSYMTCTGGLDSWMYILTRQKNPSAGMLQKLEKKVEEYGFDMNKVLPVPHEGAPEKTGGFNLPFR